MRRVLIVALMLVGCRAAEPAAGSWSSVQVGRITRDGPTGWGVLSSNAELQPFANLLNESVQVVLPLFDDLAVFFEGETERFVPRDGIHEIVTRPVQHGTTAQLEAELADLPPALRSIVGGGGGTGPTDGGSALPWGGDPVCPAPGPPPGGGVSGGAGGGGSDTDPADFFNDIRLVSPSNSVSMRWDPRGLAMDGTPALLRVGTRFNLQTDMVWWLDALMESASGQVEYAHIIAPTPCGGSTGRACSLDGQNLFEGYRSLLPGFGTDARLPRQGLDFSHLTSEPAVVGSHVTIGPRCTFMMPFLVAIASLVAPVGFIAAPFAPDGLCFILRDTLESGMIGPLCDIAGQLKQLASIMVNPPVLRLSLRQAAFAAGAARVDVNEDGVIDINDLRRQDIQNFLTPLVGGVAASVIEPSADLITLGLSPTVTYTTSEGVQTAKLSDLAGALTDEGIQAIALGGSVLIDDAGIDLSNVAARCGDDEPPPLCAVCAGGLAAAPEGVCVDGLPASEPIAQSLLAEDGTPILPALTIQPSPRIAALLSGAPLVGEVLRHYFARPLPPGGRYVSALSVGTSTATGARFDYIVDPDEDGIDAEEDNCPLTPNTDQANADMDALGDACDPCPGVHNSRRDGQFGEAFVNGDADGDGLPNGCDCDIDNDGCFNPGQSYLGGNVDPDAVVYDCEPGVGQTFENLAPRDDSDGDFDGDGHPDLCDADYDEDGVVNEADNCPLGDGDDVYEPGIDDDPSQRNSGGAALGDICDPICGPGGPPICHQAPGDINDQQPAPPGEGGMSYIPGIPVGICGGALCESMPFLPCIGAELDRCGDFMSDIFFYDTLGRASSPIYAQNLGIDAPLTSILDIDVDLDGDGVGERLVTAPLATIRPACVSNNPNQDCVTFPVQNAGTVLIIGSRDGVVLRSFSGVAEDEEFGSSAAAVGQVLVVGASGAAQGRGELHIYRLDTGEEHVVTGRRGAGLGDEIQILESSWPPTFVASAPSARRRQPKLVVFDVHGNVTAEIGQRRPSFASFAVLHDGNGGVTIAAGAPSARHGRGLVFWFDMAGQMLLRERGAPNERLGTALAADGARLFVGAPGATQGQGAVRTYEYGQSGPSYAYWGEQVGSRLTLVPATASHGGQLWVSMNANEQAVTVPWPLENL